MTFFLTDLADACRASGLPVLEEPGWRTRGQGGLTAVKGIVCHWTATPDTVRPAEDYPSLAIVRDGRAGLRGLLSQLGLGRAGIVRPIGAGLAYHAGSGYWPGIGSNGNANMIGIEAEEGGDGDWSAGILHAYPQLVAALCLHYRIPIGNVVSHHEWAGGRKSDIKLWPGGMNAFRSTVHTLLTTPEVSEEDDDMVRFMQGDHPTYGKAVFKVDYSDTSGNIAVRTHVPSPTEPGYAAFLASGGRVHRVPQHILDAIPYKTVQ